jgi:hypothetical protein
MGTIPGEEGFCSLVTKHDRKMVPQPKLFVLKKSLQKQRPQCQKTVFITSLDENAVCSLETLHDRRTALGPKLFISVKRFTGTKATTPRNCPGFES